MPCPYACLPLKRSLNDSVSMARLIVLTMGLAAAAFASTPARPADAGVAFGRRSGFGPSCHHRRSGARRIDQQDGHCDRRHEAGRSGQARPRLGRVELAWLEVAQPELSRTADLALHVAVTHLLGARA